MYLRTLYVERKTENRSVVPRIIVYLYWQGFFLFYFFYLSQTPTGHIVTIINISHTFHSKTT